MNASGKINHIRRLITHKLTANIGKTSKNKLDISDYKNKVIKILIVRPNHRLGNLLLITPIIQEIEKIFPEASVDLFVKGFLSEVIFKNYKSINKHIILPRKPFKNLFKYFYVWYQLVQNKYDLVISIDEGSSSGRLATSFVSSKFKIVDQTEGLDNRSNKINHIAIRPIIYLRDFINIELNQNDIFYSLDLKLDRQEMENGKTELFKILPNQKKTISIFTYATGDKILAKEWWYSFYELLLINFPDYNIIEILPIENVSQIDFKAPSFYSKDIREMAAIIANTEIFIGADSGIMHLAVASNTATIGLLSGGFKNKYEPYGNNNIGIDKNESSQDSLIVKMTEILSKSDK